MKKILNLKHVFSFLRYVIFNKKFTVNLNYKYFPHFELTLFQESNEGGGGYLHQVEMTMMTLQPQKY